MDSRNHRPTGVAIIAVVNAVGAVLTFAFWLLGGIRLFGKAQEAAALPPAWTAATLGLLVGDVVWALPLLALSVPGLWRLRPWGWTLAQMVNALWAYALTIVWVRDLYAGRVSPGAVLFTPFAIVAIWAAVYLWKARAAFWSQGDAAGRK